jgi:hypothetical protein
LEVWVHVRNHRLRVDLAYSERVHDRSQVRELALELHSALNALLLAASTGARA